MPKEFQKEPGIEPGSFCCSRTSPVPSGSMEPRPPADPAKLLAFWMEWEKGETPPGRVMANLKTGGLRELLEGIVAGGTDG